jgi:ribosomal protein L37AE/L43A
VNTLHLQQIGNQSMVNKSIFFDWTTMSYQPSHKKWNAKKSGYQCKKCDERRVRIQNGRWASYCITCGIRFDVGLWWKRVEKRLIRL